MFGAVPRYNLGDFLFQGKSMTEIITEGPMGIGFISGGAGILSMNQLADEQIRYLVRVKIKDYDTMLSIMNRNLSKNSVPAS